MKAPSIHIFDNVGYRCYNNHSMFRCLLRRTGNGQSVVSDVVSFAFWYKEAKENGEGKGERLSATINFNLWCQCGWETEYPYLDIGFKVKNLSQAEMLLFYLPLTIPEPHGKYIADLGEKFTKTELIDAVFNKNYSAELAASSKTIKVKSIDTEEEPDVFRIYEIDIAHDIELVPFISNTGYKGTIMKIPVAHIVAKDAGRESENGCDNYYFRFRIKNLPLDFLIHGYTPRHAALQSIFNTTHMIDFRYHNIRSLDKSLVERFYAPGHRIVSVDAIHFLLITKAYVNVSGEQFKNTRKIEQQVWEEYVDGNNTEDLVAYNHVDIGNTGEMFVRLQVQKSVIGVYIFTVILMGVASSLIASLMGVVSSPIVSWLMQFFPGGS